MLLMGVDMGTSGCKAVVFNENWDVVCQAYREYPMHFPGEGFLELDSELVWQGISEVIIEVNDSCKDKIEALAISAIGDVIIPIGLDGKQVRNSIIDFDMRGQKQLDRFVETFGKKRFFDLTGMPPLFIGSLAKMLWIKENEPENFFATKRWATYEDFIIQKLGLEPTVSYSEAARTMLFDIRKKDWCEEILNEIGISTENLPKAVASAVILGELDHQIIKDLHFANPVKVVSGGHDMVCAAIGGGLDEKKPELAVNIVGTIEGIVAALEHPTTSQEMLDNAFPCYPGYDGYVTFSVNLTSGCIVRWYRDMLADDEYKYCKDNGINFYEYMQRKMDVENPSRLLFVPHFSGSGNPFFNPHAEGGMYGLTLDTTRQDIARAMLEGLCYEIKMHSLLLERAGLKIKTLRAVGGGAQMDDRLQLKSNITGLQIIKGTVLESSALGAAAFAGVAVGLIEKPTQAFKKANQKIFSTNLQANEKFNKAYKRYEKFVQVINGI